MIRALIRRIVREEIAAWDRRTFDVTVERREPPVFMEARRFQRQEIVCVGEAPPFATMMDRFSRYWEMSRDEQRLSPSTHCAQAPAEQPGSPRPVDQGSSV